MPAGFSFAAGSLCPLDPLLGVDHQIEQLLQHFRVRRQGMAGLASGASGGGPGRVGVSGAYFPLLATIIPRWLQALEESGGRKACKVPGHKLRRRCGPVPIDAKHA